MLLGVLLNRCQHHLLLIDRHLGKLRVLLHHLWRLQFEMRLVILFRLNAGVLTT